MAHCEKVKAAHSHLVLVFRVLRNDEATCYCRQYQKAMFYTVVVSELAYIPLQKRIKRGSRERTRSTVSVRHTSNTYSRLRHDDTVDWPVSRKARPIPEEDYVICQPVMFIILLLHTCTLLSLSSGDGCNWFPPCWATIEPFTTALFTTPQSQPQIQK